ncbi:TPR-like protein [Athelia psychrophila]|uniref:TPR-like protein n=1 Tax=Athelia psychrophila TaxID=1759441 RepID=A0A166DAL4_9AGAM|nr:TPR-like protein [Fibularhizoctonia sp. CBS 109695]
MSQAYQFPAASGIREDALTLLRLAEAIPSDSFPVLKGVAATSLAIAGSVAKFKSNRKAWASFGRHILNAVAGVVHSLGALETFDLREAAKESMENFLEVLRTVQTAIDKLQHVNLFERMRIYSKDPEMIAEMKKQLGLATIPFHLKGQSSDEGRQPERLLEIITEIYRDKSIPQHLLARSSAEDANRMPVASQNSSSLSPMPAVLFNTSSTSGGTVVNVAGDHNVYGLDDELSAIKVALGKLAYAHGASWDPDLVCLPGTRTNILSVVGAWSRSLDSQNVFWLNGVAGSGKSAIAHTIAKMLHEDGLLASSFFFDREFDSRNTTQLLVSTIARDIAARHPIIAADISTALDDPALASASLARQFDAFIAQPLRRHKFDQPIVVVIDALDEGVQDDSGFSILSLFRDKVAKFAPQLRVLITSRPTRNITQYLSEQDHIASHTMAVDSPENIQDIKTYIDAQVRDMTIASQMGSPWPDEALVRELKALAEGLFIWIVTIFAYLRSAHKPRAKLRALLSNSDVSGVLSPRKKMDALYAAILEACGDWGDPDFCADYLIFMGAIMAAKRPLSLGALRALHSDSQEMAPEHLLQRFGSVLLGLNGEGETIRILHLSFREFITDRADNSQLTQKFYLSEKAHSGRLAKLCLQTMVREITSAGISGTGYLLKDFDNGPGIPEVTGVSEQLLYGCEYWIDHISDVEDKNIAICEVLQEFLTHHNIFWMEIVSSKSVFRGSMAAWRWSEAHAPELRALHYNELQADILRSLSRRLEYAGRRKQALTAIQESVFVLRTLAAERPAAFNADLAGSLNSLSICLSELGQQEEALTVIQEAVDLYRTPATERPEVFNDDLATSLDTLSNCLSDLGQREEALAANQEAVVLHRELATERPAAFNADLARSLTNLSSNLSALGQREEAMSAIQEAVGLRRALATERPAAFNADLAMSLHNLSSRLSEHGQWKEALAAIQESVDLHRVLVTERPAVFNHDLAMSLSNLSGRLSDLGQQEDALAAIQESTDLYRTLATERPAAFNADLAKSLNSLSVRLFNHGWREEALVAIQEAVVLDRELAAEQPAVFSGNLAMSLNNQSGQLFNLGRREEAIAASQEAVDLRRTLATERPVVFNAELARSLNNLSSYLSNYERQEEALAAIQEAGDLYRTLATEQPAVFNAELARSLHNLSSHLSNHDRQEEALAAIQEAVGMRRALASERPAVFNAELARSLNNLSSHLSNHDRQEEALAVIQEAEDLYRALAAEKPAAFNADLASSLNNLSSRLSNHGRQEEALAAIQEAVSLRRALASERPAAFNAPLARSLDNLARCLSDLGRQEEAIPAIREALDLYRALAADRPALYRADLIDSLEWLSGCLLEDGQEQEAEMISRELADLQ